MSYAKTEHIEADAIEAGLEDIHPRLRDKYLRKVEKAKCRACPTRLPVNELSEDGLCPYCHRVTKGFEEGRL